MGPASGRFLRPSTVYFHYFLLTFKLFKVASCFFFFACSLQLLLAYVAEEWDCGFLVTHVLSKYLPPCEGFSPILSSNWWQSSSNKGNTGSGGSVSWKPYGAGKGDAPGDCLPLAISCGMPQHRSGSTPLHNAGACMEPHPSGPESPESDPVHTLLLGWKEAADSDVHQSPAAGSRGERGTVIREEELYPSSGIYLSSDLT